MLSLGEFTVSLYKDIVPVSLILPMNEGEGISIVGTSLGVTAGVVLPPGGDFNYFPCNGIDFFYGVIVQKLGIEIDENSRLNLNHVAAPVGSLIRKSTRIFLSAQNSRSFGRGISVDLYTDLPDVGELAVGFSRWRVVVGVGQDKRVLWRSHSDL